MQFRSPDVGAHRAGFPHAPDRDGFGQFQVIQAAGLAQFDTVKFGGGTDEPVTPRCFIAVDPGVCALQNHGVVQVQGAGRCCQGRKDKGN